jgi:mannose-6-phosphate isomerase-like protein (cupin superfamily)
MDRCINILNIINNGKSVAQNIGLEDRTIELNPNQGVTISKGVLHRPRAPHKTIMSMMETSTIQPTGN